MSSAFLPFALAFDHLLSNAFLFLPSRKQGSGLGSILICPLNFSSQSQTLFRVLRLKTDVHSIHVGHRSIGLLHILPLPFHLNHVQSDDDLQRVALLDSLGNQLMLNRILLCW